MKVKIFYLLFFTILFANSQSIKLTASAEVSMITIEPGVSLNDTWGHSAIRIQDRKRHVDIVYNYGTYDFDTPNFYTKFMRGQLLFDLGIGQFHDFYRHYKYQNRGVTEQVLDLKQEEKQAYLNYLQNNAKPENKKYLYDFFFDNCATKLRVVNTDILKNKVIYKDKLLDDGSTFRELIYKKLDNHAWGKFGIDIALGSVIDRKATPKEFTFLPSYVFENFKTAEIVRDGKTMPLIKQTNYLYKQRESEQSSVFSSLFIPMLLFSVLALIVLFFTYRDFKKKKQTKIIDFLLLFITGLVGLLVVLLWFATDHTATKNNFNVFWAFLPNLFFAFYVYKEKKKGVLKKYYLLLIFLLVIMIALWLLKIQVFNLAMIPVLVMLGVRYFYNYLRK